jgi:hypothetical protein
MTNERHTRREFLGIAGEGVAGVATGASFDHKRSEKPSHFWLHNCCRTGVGSYVGELEVAEPSSWAGFRGREFETESPAAAAASCELSLVKPPSVFHRPRQTRRFLG